MAELVYHPELVEQPIGAKERLQFRLPYMSPGSCVFLRGLHLPLVFHELIHEF